MTLLDDLLKKIDFIIDKIKSYSLEKTLDGIPYNTEDYRYDTLIKSWVPKTAPTEELYGIQIALEKLSDSIDQESKGVKFSNNVIGSGASINGVFDTEDFLYNQITVKLYTSAGGLTFFDLEIQVTDSSATQAELLKTHIIEGDRVCMRTFSFNPTHDINYYFKNNGSSTVIVDFIFSFSSLEQKNVVSFDSRIAPETTITRQFQKYGNMFNRMRIILRESATINANYVLTQKTNASAMTVELINETITTGNDYDARHGFKEASFLELVLTNNDTEQYLYFQIILFFSMLGDDTAYNESTWNNNLDTATKNVIRDKIESVITAYTDLINGLDYYTQDEVDGHNWLEADITDLDHLTEVEALAYVEAQGLSLADAKVIVSQDADIYFNFGRTRIGYSIASDNMGIMHIDMTGAGQYALVQGSTGNTYLSGVTTLNFRISNVHKMLLTASLFTMYVPIAMGTSKITGCGDPTNNQDVVTKIYSDFKLLLTGGTMSGAIAMGTNKITGCGDPDNDQDVATKKYVVDNAGVQNEFYVESDDLVHSNDSEQYQTSKVYVKIKEIKCYIKANLRVYWEHKYLGTAGQNFTRLYVNGVAVGSEFENTTSYTSETEDISVDVDDLIQIYGYGYYGEVPYTANRIYVQNMRIKFADFVNIV